MAAEKWNLQIKQNPGHVLDLNTRSLGDNGTAFEVESLTKI